MGESMTGTESKEKASSSSPFGWFWSTLDDYLAEHQLKQTKQRKVVVEHFLELDRHIAAEDLHESVRGAGHNIGLATIYRTLNLLEDAGLAEQKEFGDGRSLFEICQPGEHHDHLICTGCGLVIEFENAEIERLQEKVARAHKFTLTNHRLDLFGQCEKCSRK